MDKDKKEIVILGAGLAGLSAAWHLRNKRRKFLIFEKEPEAGGLCRSKKIRNFTFDYDGHLLHFRDKNTRNFIEQSLGLELNRHKRKSFVYLQKKEVAYPFQANFLSLPARISSQCLSGLRAAERIRSNGHTNFKEWIYASFGKGIAEHFMLPYNEKFWNFPLSKLTCDWLDGFIPRLRSRDIIGKTSQSLSSIGYNSCFFYPKNGGISKLPNSLKENISRNLFLNSNITKIDISKKEIEVNSRQRFSYHKAISTIPLPELKNIIEDLPLEICKAIGRLNFNSILVFNLAIKSQIPRDKHWVYFPEKQHKFFRVGFYHSFSNNIAPKGCSSLYAEVAYANKGVLIDKDKIKQEVIDNLLQEKIIRSADDIVYCDAIDIQYGYPIYDFNYKKAVSKILSFLTKHKIYSIGRYGSWRYMTMEDALMDGKKTTEVI